MSPECIPYYEPGAAISAKAEAAVVGCRFVMISDPMEGPADMGLSSTSEGSNIICSHATEDGDTIGVASYDAAIGERFYVVGQPGIVVPCLADGAITAGDRISVGADGKAKTSDGTGMDVGIALDTSADAAFFPVKLFGFGLTIDTIA